LNNLVSNASYSKIFEVGGDSENFYIFTHNNKKMNQNKRNQFFAEISLTRVKQSQYLQKPRYYADESIFDKENKIDAS